MSIVLIRHAETDLNAGRVLQWPDTPLSERGRAQARAVAARFAAAARPGAILSSEMARARDTAAALSGATGVPVTESTLLGERNFGALRGLRYDQLERDPIRDERAPPGGESMPEFRDRVARALDWVREVRRQVDGDVLVVTHGLVIRVLLEEHVRFAPGEAAPASIANTSVSILQPDRPHAVSLINCARHLEGATRDDGRGVSGI